MVHAPIGIVVAAVPFGLVVAVVQFAFEVGLFGFGIDVPFELAVVQFELAGVVVPFELVVLFELVQSVSPIGLGVAGALLAPVADAE